MKTAVEYSWVSAATLGKLIEETCKQIAEGWTPKDPIVIKQKHTASTDNQPSNSYSQKMYKVIKPVNQ